MKIRKRIVCVSLTIGILTALFWAIPFHGLHAEATYDVESNDEVTDYETMQLTGTVEQRFTAGSYVMNGINIVIVGLSDDPDGILQLQICDESHEKVVKQDMISYRDIVNGDWTNLEERTRLVKGESYILRLVNLSETETPYLLTTQTGTTSKYNTSLEQDGVAQKGNLIMGYGFYGEISRLEKGIWLSIGLFLIGYIWILFLGDGRLFEQIENLIPWKEERLTRLMKHPMGMGALIGGIVFLLVYGILVLNPTYTDWLMTGGDLTQHYLGWKFFRNGDWNFPIGLIDAMTYPNKVSVIYTDSIPLFAVFFKIFRNVLPASFQYFGWWGFLSMILQGAFAGKILSRYLKDDMQLTLGILFMTLSPVFLNRMFYHTTLASHWLILATISLVLDYTEMIRSGKGWKWILFLGVMIPWIHIYFLPMCGIFILVYAILHGKRKKTIKYFLADLSLFLAGAMASIWLLGGFSSGVNYHSTGLGRFGFNLNALVNPMTFSSLLADKGRVIFSQREGFAYLGLGIMVLGALALVHAIYQCVMKEASNNQLRNMLIMLACLILGILAMSNQITFGDRVLIQIPLPEFVNRLWSIFRASGRLIWPLVYLIMIAAIGISTWKMGPGLRTIILLSCLLLQLLDLHGMITDKHDLFFYKQEKSDQLDTAKWQQALQKEAGKSQHIYFMEYELIYDQQTLYTIADLASDYHMTINNFYLARDIEGKVTESLTAELNHPQEGDLFIMSSGDEASPQLFDAMDMQWQTVGNYEIGSFDKMDTELVYQPK